LIFILVLQHAGRRFGPGLRFYAKALENDGPCFCDTAGLGLSVRRTFNPIGLRFYADGLEDTGPRFSDTAGLRLCDRRTPPLNRHILAGRRSCVQLRVFQASSPEGQCPGPVAGYKFGCPVTQSLKVGRIVDRFRFSLHFKNSFFKKTPKFFLVDLRF
jgi:hypothetical protein